MCMPGKWFSFWYPANFITLSDETDVSIHIMFQSCKQWSFIFNGSVRMCISHFAVVGFINNPSLLFDT